MEPRISVIIPTYNRASLVKNAIESVIGQSYGAHEIIVVDDGSTDGTGQAIEGGYGDRINYVRQENQGPSVARNHGAKLANGDWIAFLDSDDTWKSEKLEWQVRAIRKYGDDCGACFTDCQFVNNPYVNATAFERAKRSYDGDLAKIEKPAMLVAGGEHGFQIQALLVRRELFVGIGSFDTKLFLHEDTDLIFRLGLETKFCCVNKPLVEVDRTPNRAVGLIELLEKDEIRLQQRQWMYEKWVDLPGLEVEMREPVASRLASIHSQWANLHLLSNQPAKARQSMLRALKYSRTLKTLGKCSVTFCAPFLAKRLAMHHEAEKLRNVGKNW